MKRKSLGERLRTLFGGGAAKEASLEELEDLLIESDIGATVALSIVDIIREEVRGGRASREELIAALRSALLAIVRETEVRLDPDRLNIVLVLGVNGVGKTTSLAKLATHFRRTGEAATAVIAAGDTFRAAAVEQLTVHANRLGARIIAQGSGADPAAVIYDAIESAKSNGDTLVLADTAGRMHTKQNLVNELAKIDRIVASRAPDAAYKRLLVIDATTGQNALRQAEVFSAAVSIDGILLAKYDSTAKGGILVPIARELDIPAAFLGTGERYEDLVPFSAERYVDELLGVS